MLVLFLAPLAPAATESTVYVFGAPGSGDGMYPRSTPVFDPQGNLYGTTQMGGSHNAGIVFELSPADGQWIEKVLYEFTGTSDGGYPSAGLTFDSDGNLFGTGSSGGSNGTGVVFELSPNGAGWKYSVLYSFGPYPNSSDGFDPNSQLIFDKLGNIYGTTYEGGVPGCFQGCGTVFQLSPIQGGEWKEQVIHAFVADGNDGLLPGGVAISNNGTLYGTTQNGGVAGSGVLYLLKYSSAKKKWIETIMHQFVGGDTDGAYPEGKLLIDRGHLYGTSEGGGTSSHGTVFETKLSKKTGWATTVLHSFGDSFSGDGIGPQAGLTVDARGNIYGTTFYGGEFNYYGTVFELSKKHHAWIETVLHSFNDTDGDSPSSDLTLQNGWLYGTTSTGGNVNGVVFRIQP